MNAKDQSKILKVGFTIIRAESLGDRHRIKVKGTGEHEWKTLEKGFPSKSAMQKRMKELLESSMIVED